MNAKRAEETADVVSDCVDTQLKFGGDLLRRAAELQKAKHLDLTGGEMRVWHSHGKFVRKWFRDL